MSVGQLSPRLPTIESYKLFERVNWVSEGKKVQAFYDENIAPLVEKISNIGLVIALLDIAQTFKWINLGKSLPTLLACGYAVTILTSGSEIFKESLKLALEVAKTGNWSNIILLNLVSHTCMVAWASLRLSSHFIGAPLVPLVADILLSCGFFSFMASVVCEKLNEADAK